MEAELLEQAKLARQKVGGVSPRLLDPSEPSYVGLKANTNLRLIAQKIFFKLKAWLKLILYPERTARSINAIETNLNEMQHKIAELYSVWTTLDKKLLPSIESALRSARYSQPSNLSATLTEQDTLSETWNFFYRAFEDKFRGTKDATQAKQIAYIKELSKYRLTTGMRALDLGCGRCEWLSCLKDAGAVVQGVDLNESMVEDAKQLGIDVKIIDGLSYLTTLPDQSLDLISAFHVIEHVSSNYLLSMIAECKRVLSRGGLLLLETPNPENIVVGACNFYTDLTHKRPIPPQTLGFILEFAGLQQLDCIRSSPVSMPESSNSPTKELLHFFTVGQDYAILARNPA